jgi:uncharacterized protein
VATVGRLFQPPKGSFFLFGPRGTGKSTWLQGAFPDALRIDLLAPEIHRAYVARPERLRELLDAHPKRRVVVIDEVQRVPALLDVVHEQIEAHNRTRRFILTGSSARKLKRAGVNLLAGRAIRTALHPFMAAELGAGFDLERALTVGLVPLVWDADEPARTLQGYLSLYIREEVQAEGLVRDLGGFARFVEAISFSQGSPLNLANVSRECDVSRKTAEGYLAVLEDLLLAFAVPVFSRRAKRHLQSHPKFYWFDAGVFRSARPAGPLDRPAEVSGVALESLVAQHLRAWIDYSVSDATLSYWRTKSGNEVDFVIYGKTGFWAIEVKNARRVHSSDLGGLRAFRVDYPEARVALIHRGPERLVIDGVPCIPAKEFLATLVPGVPIAL